MEMNDEFELMFAQELENELELEADNFRSENKRPRDKTEDNEEHTSSTKKPKLNDVFRKLFTEDHYNKLDTQQIQKKVWKRIPPGNFIPVTCPETKNRVYLKIRSENYITPRFEANVIKELVSTPFAILRQQAEVLRQRSETKESVLNEEKIAGELWVDKFKPQNYIDLLSDDGINRNLLRWLKLWDKVVFDREYNSNKEKKKSQIQQTGIKKISNQVVEELDSTGCPAQRLALLCGPPGLGKTTLAHIIANHAGYNVVELNASDDRSPEQFRRQIEASTQMKSVLDPRPNCLVIDEIDGAPAASINLLVTMTTAKESTTRKDKRKNSSFGLRRPVICICNDQYVAALRPLRQLALVLSFPPIASTRLAFRLQDILNVQKYILDLSTLLALCKKTDNDVRSCLATLQFVFGRSKKKNVSLSTVLSSTVGVKDAQKSHFQIWKDVFCSDIKDGIKKKTVDKQLECSDTRFDRLVRNAQANGDYDKMYQGVFDNYLIVRNKRLDDICEVINWFEFVDSIQKQMYESQSFILQSYLPLACAFFHSKLASSTPCKLEYSSVQTEVRNKTNACHNLIETLNQDQAPTVRSMCSRHTLLLDILPFVSLVLTPPLRPVNTRLLSVRERNELNWLVDLMLVLNLTYVQKKTSDGQYSFELEPNLHDLVYFECNSQQHRNLTYAAKQLVAREIELEKVRRREKTEKQREETHSKSLNVIVAEKNSNLVERTNVDFFGRNVAITPSSECTNNPKSSSSYRSSGVWFRFKEGYSNAVRRNVRILDLLC